MAVERNLEEMKIVKPKGLLVAAVFSLIACLFQIIGLIRYLGRLPDDWIGIALYLVTIVAFSLGAIGFYVQWRKQKQVE
jgi:hypothetical protein